MSGGILWRAPALAVAGALMLSFSLSRHADAAVVVDFESQSEPGTGLNLFASPYLEDGVVISSTSNFSFIAPQESNIVRRTSTTVWTLSGVNMVTVALEGGGVFSLLSLDFGVINNIAPGTATIVGHIHGGGTVSQLLDYDETLAPPAALETFVLAGFTNLDSVTWTDVTATSFDNLVIEPGAVAVPVPEPMALGVLAAGLLGLALRRRATV